MSYTDQKQTPTVNSIKETLNNYKESNCRDERDDYRNQLIDYAISGGRTVEQATDKIDSVLSNLITNPLLKNYTVK